MYHVVKVVSAIWVKSSMFVLCFIVRDKIKSSREDEECGLSLESLIWTRNGMERRSSNRALLMEVSTTTT